MQTTLAILLFGLIGIAIIICPSNGQVATSEVLDRINVDTYLQNRRLVEYHINCLVYAGPCDKIGNEIKRLFNSLRYGGLSTSDCPMCSEEQKRRLAKISRHWQTFYPAAWRDLSQVMRT